VLVPVPLPAVTADDDARAAFLKDDAALMTANRRIRTGRGCVADLRKAYAPAPAPALAAAAATP
jgi:hypothetical protein